MLTLIMDAYGYSNVYRDFNTSHVNVNHIVGQKAVTEYQFQYISC